MDWASIAPNIKYENETKYLLNYDELKLCLFN